VIQPIRPQDASGIYQRQVEQAPATGPGQRSTPRGLAGSDQRHDQVSVSSRAHQLRRVMETMPAVEDVRADRVAELQARIEAGDYQVDATAVARRLLDDGLAL
jgi:flagellar biosynthesis anti-sigma factor FlgM